MTIAELVATIIAIGVGIIACTLAYYLQRQANENRRLRQMIYSKEVGNFILIQKLQGVANDRKEKDKPEAKTDDK